MDKESMIQAAEDEWLALKKWEQVDKINTEECNWPWFWLILSESIWPTPPEFTDSEYWDNLRDYLS